jgi:hypothetical protein
VLFKTASGGVILHQLRHSALTHDAEDGVSTPMLIAKSRHIAVASLARCARPSAEALGRWQVSRDLSLRRRQCWRHFERLSHHLEAIQVTFRPAERARHRYPLPWLVPAMARRGGCFRDPVTALRQDERHAVHR